MTTRKNLIEALRALIKVADDSDDKKTRRSKDLEKARIIVEAEDKKRQDYYIIRGKDMR